MVYQRQRLAIPTNAEYSIAQLRVLLREVAQIVGRDISAEEWGRLG